MLINDKTTFSSNHSNYGYYDHNNNDIDNYYQCERPESRSWRYQPNRVGTHDNAAQTSGEGAQGGTVTDPTITGDPTVVDSG